MARDRTQLNINIDPELLLKLKAQAIKNGQTLTTFVIEQLTNASELQSNNDQLEKRLLKIEKLLNLDNNPSKDKKTIGTIFTDTGAKKYGEVAKELFDNHRKKRKIDVHFALQELAYHLKQYPHSNPELVFQILLGNHVLTGSEMTLAYKTGSCAMRSALNDWTNSPLEELNDAFLDAVITKSLA